MPRYIFDLADHESDPDQSGVTLPDDESARVEALVFAGQYLKDHPDLVWDGHEMRVHVLTEQRRPLFLVIVISVALWRPQVSANDELPFE